MGQGSGTVVAGSHSPLAQRVGSAAFPNQQGNAQLQSKGQGINRADKRGGRSETAAWSTGSQPYSQPQTAPSLEGRTGAQATRLWSCPRMAWSAGAGQTSKGARGESCSVQHGRPPGLAIWDSVKGKVSCGMSSGRSNPGGAARRPRIWPPPSEAT